MEKTSVASNDYPGIARMTMLQGLRVVTDDLICVETKVETTREPLTWWQRLRSLKPWISHRKRTVVSKVPSERIVMLGDTIVCHSETAKKILEAVEAQTKIPAPSAPTIIHKE